MTQTLILDLGSFELQLGIAGEDQPQVTEPMLFTDTSNPIVSSFTLLKLNELARERLYGRWALRFKNVLKLQFLLESQDFVSITAFLKQLLEKNYWDPRDFNLIIIDSQRFTAQFKQKVLNTFFQVLQFPQICFAPSSLCVLSALGQDSGLIVDIGFSSTTVEAVYKNFPNDESKFELPIGGFHLTQRLTDLIFSKFEYGKQLFFI